MKKSNKFSNSYFYVTNEAGIDFIGVKNGTNPELMTDDKSFVGAINEIYTDKMNGIDFTTGQFVVEMYEPYYDAYDHEDKITARPNNFFNNELTTNSKDAVGAINELNSEITSVRVVDTEAEAMNGIPGVLYIVREL